MKRFEVNMSNNKKAVIIKGMEIPKNCFKCDFRDGLTCIAADQKEIYKFRAIRKRDNFCPMIEVDADDIVSRKGLLEEYDRQHVGPPGGARKIIEKAPSAIEGEKADAQSIYLEKTESRLDDSIKDPTKDPEFTKSCLQAYKNIIATGGCNECAIRAMCNKRPDWGKLVRYNCIYFRRENNE